MELLEFEVRAMRHTKCRVVIRGVKKRLELDG